MQKGFRDKDHGEDHHACLHIQQYGATLTFILSRVSGQLMNVSPIVIILFSCF